MKNSEDCTSVRQNAEYTASRKHAANLRRNPTLHFQIGLILALLVVIFFMEVRMPETAHKAPNLDYDQEEAVWDEQFQVETKVVEAPIPKFEEPAPREPQLPDEVTKEDDDFELFESVIKGDAEVEIETPMIDPNAGVTYVEEEEEVVKVPIAFIEEAPIFPGCERMKNNDERRTCMSSKVSKLIQKKFDTELGERLGLTGVNKIDVMFTVDATGKVTDIQARAPHDKLEDETKRVIGLLPTMKPGRQNKKNIGVIYSQRISFKVED